MKQLNDTKILIPDAFFDPRSLADYFSRVQVVPNLFVNVGIPKNSSFDATSTHATLRSLLSGINETETDGKIYVSPLVFENYENNKATFQAAPIIYEIDKSLIIDPFLHANTLEGKSISIENFGSFLAMTDYTKKPAEITGQIPLKETFSKDKKFPATILYFSSDVVPQTRFEFYKFTGTSVYAAKFIKTEHILDSVTIDTRAKFMYSAVNPSLQPIAHHIERARGEIIYLK